MVHFHYLRLTFSHLLYVLVRDCVLFPGALSFPKRDHLPVGLNRYYAPTIDEERLSAFQRAIFHILQLEGQKRLGLLLLPLFVLKTLTFQAFC